MQVFATGKYETGQEAGWAEGNWNGDGVFDSSDMVRAFVDGGYEKGPRMDAAAVPEPMSGSVAHGGLDRGRSLAASPSVVNCGSLMRYSSAAGNDPFWNGSPAGGASLAAAISDTFLGTAKSCLLPVAWDAQIT